jgi:hypothetical protein
MICGQLAEWLTPIGTVGVAIVELLIALYQDEWRRRRYHPTITVTASTGLPDCVQIPFVVDIQTNPTGITIEHSEITSYYLRIRVQNEGEETARNLEVYAKKLLRQKSDGQWYELAEFQPMNFRLVQLRRTT